MTCLSTHPLLVLMDHAGAHLTAALVIVTATVSSMLTTVAGLLVLIRSDRSAT